MIYINLNNADINIISPNTELSELKLQAMYSSQWEESPIKEILEMKELKENINFVIFLLGMWSQVIMWISLTVFVKYRVTRLDYITFIIICGDFPLNYQK